MLEIHEITFGDAVQVEPHHGRRRQIQGVLHTVYAPYAWHDCVAAMAATPTARQIIIMSTDTCTLLGGHDVILSSANPPGGCAGITLIVADLDAMGLHLDYIDASIYAIAAEMPSLAWVMTCKMAYHRWEGSGNLT